MTGEKSSGGRVKSNAQGAWESSDVAEESTTEADIVTQAA